MQLIKADTTTIRDIQAIASEVWPITFGEILSPEQISYMMEMMYSTSSLERQIKELGHRYVVAYQDKRPVGYLSYESNYKGLPWTKVHKIYVLSTVQGLGVGRLLMEYAFRMARLQGDTQLSLNVNRNNPAIGFYNRVGFEVIGEEDIDIGNGFLMEDYIMNCPVPSAVG